MCILYNNIIYYNAMSLSNLQIEIQQIRYKMSQCK